MRPWPRPERPEKRDIGYGLSKAVDSGPPAKSQSLTWLKSPEPGMTAFGGGFNWSAQHSNLLSRMECGYETATSHLLLGSPTV
jgi:hypothetical protein